MTNARNNTQENAIVKRAFSAEQLKSVTSFDDVLTLAQDAGVEVVRSEVLGDGFSLCEDKDTLIGAEMLVVSWSFSAGDFGEFVAARVLAKVGGETQKLVITDGSTGIMEQLRQLSSDANGDPRVVYVPRGLRKSEYMTEILNPKTNEYEEKPASTYYLDTAGRR